MSDPRGPAPRPGAGSNAFEWLRSNEPVRMKALAAARVAPGKVTDVVLDDPARLVDIAEAMVAQAQKERAPAEILTVLKGAAEKMRAGAADLSRYEYVRTTLVGLKGKKDDAAAVTAGLRAALAGAPDEANRQKLERILEAVTAYERSSASPSMMPNEWVCCAMGCATCWMAGCLLCCAIGHFLCY